MMSHIASFAATDVTENCGIIYDKMKNSGLKISSEYYPAVALIGLLDGDTDRLTDDLIEVALYLKGQKHYKLRVVCDRMQLLGGRPSQETRPESEYVESPAAAHQADRGPAGGDDIPF